ncbi:serine/threonine-protein kinase [Nannocystis punicea]|uniref:Serine/threonine-protein kinase n=1 Tax=Nannocystis punicea TaxID=2995304 RepID=A0ABY7GYF3_9BACT|nr:serine/threonine-protein kinase [Nannocystis poenicansa]WAS91894.1 serine/threonine-protein kinase [Nannocystis poenicansa]
MDASRAKATGQSARFTHCPSCGERFPSSFRVCPRDAVELQPLEVADDDPYIGVVLSGQYRIERLIAEGGMARVYEAQHVRLPGRVFALKVLHRPLVRDSDVMMRFRREAEIAGAIDHPNILQIFNIDTTPDGTPYIVSERLQGEDLAQWLERRGRLGVSETVHILRELCAALAVVHQRGIVHRDLKPNNLFMVGDPARPTVKLLDFGIAKLHHPGDSSHTQTGAIMGTPAYMAPEQARGEVIDARADIYAAGAIGYRCVTGRPPFDVEDLAAALHAVLTSEPPRPRTFAPDLPEAFELVIQRAMAPSPDERYSTLAEFQGALERFADSSTPGPKSANAWIEQTNAESRLYRPTIVVMSVIAFIFLASGLADGLAAVFAESGGGQLAVVGTVATLATPAWLCVRFVRKHVWNNTPRAGALAHRLTNIVAAAAGAYGGLILLERLVDLLFGEALGLSGAIRTSIWLLSAAAAVAVAHHPSLGIRGLRV